MWGVYVVIPSPEGVYVVMLSLVKGSVCGHAFP